MQNIHLSTKNVSVFYGDRPVINNISLEITPGKTTIVLGSSGSGKSMLLKTLAGLVPASRGRVLINNKDIFFLSEKEKLAFRKKSSFAFQDAALWANRTVAKNVEFPLQVHYPRMYLKYKRQKVKEYLEMTGYRDSLDYLPSQLSTGEQKMVSFARALVTNPDFLFLDNPLVGIDATAGARIMEIIKKLRKEGKTLLACFGDPDIIAVVADELIIMHQGTVLLQGTLEKVQQSGDPLVRKLLTLSPDQTRAD